ncbi:MAG: radical SAM protein [Planctomycetes bacterium]|nr:radical SAM protein [Planctomycetota bacterium]
MARQKQLELFPESRRVPSGAGVPVDGAIVREVTCKSLLNRSGIDDYSFNCYTGCAHGCVYCYARFMQRFHPHDEPWGKFVDVKINAPRVLARQLRRLRPGSVFTCSACDGWQGVERHYGLTRRCCEMLLEAGFSLRVLTKSDLVLRDLDVFTGRDVRLGVTITTGDEALARLWEPAASSVAARLGVLRQAKAAGLKTTVMFGPLLPGLSDTIEALGRLFAMAAGAEVDKIWTDALNPRPRVWPAVQEFLRTHRPDLLDFYRRVLFDSAFRERYMDELDVRIAQAAAEAGVSQRMA